MIEDEINYCQRCGGAMEIRILEEKERLACTQCGLIFYRHAKLGANALIVVDEQVVLVKRAADPYRGEWSLPGGFVEYEEHPEQALLREMKEELSVEVEIIRLLGLYHNRANDMIANCIFPVYLCRICSGELCAGDDAGEVELFEPDALPTPIAFEGHRKALEDWLQERHDPRL
jgi:ADP-ribose pyrophosphatase YjhB (NUDIX family)